MKYLARFPVFPKTSAWNFGQVRVQGATVVDSDGKEWRFLCADVPNRNAASGGAVEIGLADILLFRNNFFPDGAEVMLFVPRPHEHNTFTLKLWSRVEDAVLPAREGLPVVSVIAEG